MAGVKGGGTGTKYQIDIKVNVDDAKFEYLCAKNAMLSFRVLKSDSLMPATYKSKKGDKLSLRASLRSNEVTAMCKDLLVENEVVIHYSILNNKDLTLSVKDLIQKQAKPRP